MRAESGFYRGRVFPWLNDWVCGDPRVVRLRAQALVPARGRVIEIGFGTGLNLAHYPAAVTQVVGVEPSDGMLRRAASRIMAATTPLSVIQAGAEAIPLADASFDTAVSVLTLCTVADPVRALHELRRVLRPQGRLLLLEHGLARDAAVARWQRRLNGIERVLACGCNLDRPMGELVRAAGFRFDAVDEFFMPGLPRTHAWFTLGRATAA